MAKGALIILVNEEGKVLLQHKDKAAPTHADHWTLFGGGIEPHETPTQTIHRELREELELNIGEFEHFGSYNNNDVFLAHFNPKVGELKHHLKEGDNLGLFSESEIANLPVAEPHMRILEDYFSKRLQ